MMDLTYMTKNSFTKQDLVACGRGELFGEGNSQLPVDNMLMIDRVVHISEEGHTWRSVFWIDTISR